MSNRQEQRVLHLADGAFTESPDDTPAAPEGRVRSTMRRVGLHLVNSASDLVGDDIGGRVVRRFLIQIAGGRVARTSHLLGGTRFTRPMNLRVGNRCLINRNCYLDLHGPLTIGDDVVIGHGTSIITSQHRVGPSTRRAGSVVPRPVRIFSGAWIGADAVILPGVTVGVGAIVAAGAVVTSDVAPDTVVAGVPARFVRQLGN